MPRSCGTAVQSPKPVANRRSNILIVLFQKHEVPIALDTNIGQLDPLEVGNAHLLEVLDEAVVVRDVRASLAGEHNVRHFAELCELVDCAGLENT